MCSRTCSISEIAGRARDRGSDALRHEQGALAAQPPACPTRRCGWRRLAAEHFRAEHFLVAIRTEHQAFYRRTFHHRLICDARPYPLLAKPISLMTRERGRMWPRVSLPALSVLPLDLLRAAVCCSGGTCSWPRAATVVSMDEYRAA